MKKEIELIDVESVRAYLKNTENNTHHEGARICLFAIILAVLWFFNIQLTDHPFVGQMLMAYMFSRVV